MNNRDHLKKYIVWNEDMIQKFDARGDFVSARIAGVHLGELRLRLAQFDVPKAHRWYNRGRNEERKTT